MALRGMSEAMACDGCWTIATPPRCFIAHRPAAPSSSEPDRTIPTTRGPNADAAERNSTSTDGRNLFSGAARPLHEAGGNQRQVMVGWRGVDVARLEGHAIARVNCRQLTGLAQHVSQK